MRYFIASILLITSMSVGLGLVPNSSRGHNAKRIRLWRITSALHSNNVEQGASLANKSNPKGLPVRTTSQSRPSTFPKIWSAMSPDIACNEGLVALQNPRCIYESAGSGWKTPPTSRPEKITKRTDKIREKRKIYRMRDWRNEDLSDYYPSDSLNVRLVGKLEYPDLYIDMVSVVAEGNYAYVGGYSDVGRILILDVSDTSNIRMVSSIKTGIVEIWSIFKSGNHLYCIGDNRLQIIDVLNPLTPVRLGFCVFPPTEWVSDIYVSGNYAYIGERYGLRVVDISDPSSPLPIGYLSLNRCIAVTVQNRYAYIIEDWYYFSIIDVSNPRTPVRISQVSIDDITDVAVRDSFAFISGDGFWVYNISNPSQPQEVTYFEEMVASTIELSGSYAYLGGEDGLWIIDISIPSNPLTVAIFGEVDFEEGDGISVRDRIVYTASDEEFLILDCSDFGPPVVGRTGNWYGNGIAVKDSFAYVAAWNYDGPGKLQIVNISNPTNPIEKGSCSTYYAMDVSVLDYYAYVADWDSGLKIIDVSDPNNPTLVGEYNTPGFAYGIDVKDTFAYVADLYSLRIINVSDPTNPFEVGYCSTSAYDYTREVYVKDTFAYIAKGGDGLRIINISDPANPYEVGFYYDPNWWIYDVYVLGNLAYVSGRNFGIIDVANPSNPFFIGSLPEAGEKVFVKDTLAYITSFYGLKVINISNPSNPVKIGTANISVNDVWVIDNYAYTVYHGLNVVDISDLSGGIFIAGRYETEEEGGNRFRDIFVSENYVYTASDSGLEVINITTPSSPRLVGKYSGQYFFSLDYQNYYCYALNYDSLYIIDVSEPTNPVCRGTYPNGTNNFRDLDVKGNFAYLCESYHNYGLRILDVSDPSNPVPRGFLSLNRYLYSVAVSSSYPYAYISCFGNPDSLFVIDISNPSNPRRVTSRSIDTGFARKIHISGIYLYVATAYGGLLIFDISNPTNPVKIGRYQTSEASWFKDVFVSGNFAYVVDDYFGLRVIDVSDVRNPRLVGYYKYYGQSYSVSADNRYAYLGVTEGLLILETQIPAIAERNSFGEPALLFNIKSNPTKGTIKVNYTLPNPPMSPFNKGGSGDFATLKVYNTLGSLVYFEKNNKGFFLVKGLPAGIYFLRFEAKGYKSDKKIIVVK